MKTPLRIASRAREAKNNQTRDGEGDDLRVFTKICMVLLLSRFSRPSVRKEMRVAFVACSCEAISLIFTVSLYCHRCVFVHFHVSGEHKWERAALRACEIFSLFVRALCATWFVPRGMHVARARVVTCDVEKRRVDSYDVVIK